MTKVIEQLVSDAISSIETEITRHGKVALALSGGKDSLALLHLARQFRDKIVVLSVDTGYHFPHMRKFIADTAVGWDYQEVKSDLSAQWCRRGLPVDVVPMLNHADAPVPKYPRLQFWISCCQENVLTAMSEHAKGIGVSLILNGQRESDGAPMKRRTPLLNYTELFAPLWDWTDDNVYDFITMNNITLPHQYSVGCKQSLDCWACTGNVKREKIDYLKKFYPDHWAQLEPNLRTAYNPSVITMGEIADDMRPKVDSHVQQRGFSSDCMIAALANALGWTYEDVASLLLIPLDASGAPASPDQVVTGTAPDVIAAPLLRAGWAVSPLGVAGGPFSCRTSMTRSELLDFICGRRAVLVVQQGGGMLHALGWDGAQAHDGSHEAFRPQGAGQDVVGAVLLTPVPRTDPGL